MIQVVKATDKFENQLFQWDVEQQIISLSHGKNIWFAKLDDDGKFKVIEHKPKTQPTAIKHN